MGRFIQNCDSHGSLKNLQTLVNIKKDLFDKKLSEIAKRKWQIDWKSPLKADQYAEYRDNDFIKILGLVDKIKYALIDFWPKNGPQWDALGICKDSYFVVEAKAHIPEMVSPGTGAGIESKDKIQRSLSELKKYLNISKTPDWTNIFYQYVNRLAHLYYLRERNGIDAYLIFLYFTNDVSVQGPKSIDEWEGAIQVIDCYLGLSKNHKLKKYTYEVFIDVKELQ